MPPNPWTHQSDKDLLLSIIEGGTLKNVNWQAIESAMKAKGYSYTHEGCRQHFQKIRKESRSSGGSTPNSAKKSTSTSKKRTASKATTSEFTGDNQDDDEQYVIEDTPSKRTKKDPAGKSNSNGSVKGNGKGKDKVKEEGYDLGGMEGQTGTYFKIEGGDGESVDEKGRTVVDLIRDDLYADDSPTPIYDGQYEADLDSFEVS